ncbi:MAG: hypothetical protein HQL10_10825 [Nitrospirae bacterium]|nr:hypothetical protein [Nitrospirota bacterium]
MNRNVLNIFFIGSPFYNMLEEFGGRDTVTVRKLMSYVEERLPDITKKYKQEPQFPVVDSRGMDFPLVIGK